MKTFLNQSCLMIGLLALIPTTRAASVLQFPISTCMVTEGAWSLEVPVQRANDLDTVVTVVVSTVPGTATPGVDYTSIATNLTFQAGQTNGTARLPILKHGRVGPATSFQVRLSGPTGGAVLGSVTNLTVNIWNGNTGLHFYPAPLSVNEDAGEVSVRVARGDDGDGEVSVDYATRDGTAKAGQDYTATSGTLVFEPGEVMKLFTVPILNDALPEPSRVFSVILSNATGGAVLGSPSVAGMTITDTDRVLRLDATNYPARREAQFVQFAITQGENHSAATVDFKTLDGTAKAGLDYAGVTNTVPFESGDRLQWVRVPLLKDPVNGSSTTFHVMLVNPTGGAVLGTQRDAVVTLTDHAPGVGFTTNTFWAWESAGSANVTVVRDSDDLASTLTVAYRTSNGTALAGRDYQAVSNTFEFGANETLKAITVPLLENPGAKGQKTFFVTLSYVSAGVPLRLATTQVKIPHPQGYYPILPWINAQPKLRQEGGVNLLTWEGDGVLQRAGQVTGPWEDLPGAASPYATVPNSPGGFYRIRHSRPAEVYVPSGYDGRTPLPLIVVLHAMGSASDFPDAVATVRDAFPLAPLAESRGFLLCYPSGTIDAAGNWWWNGTDVLNLYGSTVDDSGYLRGVIEEIARQFAVDPKRIYVTGYSNGGNMCHRLACDHADVIAAIAPMSGAGIYYDPSACHPTQPVNVLQMVGTLDAYLGGTFTGVPVVGESPGATRTVQIWAALNGCQDPVVEVVPSLDVTQEVTGLDTTVLRYTQCPPGGSVELWTVNGGDHYLFWQVLSPHFLEYLVDWLLAHPKP